MRRASVNLLLLCVALVACRKPTAPMHSQAGRVLAVDGIQVYVPDDLVRLEDERTQRLRDSYIRQEPGSDVTIAAVRGATLLDATVYVARGVSHRDLPAGTRTVRDGLNLASGEMADVLRRGGAQAKDLQTAERNGGLETCLTAVLPAAELPPTRLCALFYLGADARLRTLSATCLARDATLCERVLSSRTYEVSGALELAKSLDKP